MTIGDLLEILAAACAFVAFFVWFGVAAALMTACVFFVYEAQCWAAQPLPKIQRDKLVQTRKRVAVTVRKPRVLVPRALRRWWAAYRMSLRAVKVAQQANQEQ